MPDTLSLDRAALGVVFKDPRTLLAFEAFQKIILDIDPALIASLGDAEYVVSTSDSNLPNSRLMLGSPGFTIDASVPNLVHFILNVAAALGYTPANQTDVTTLQTDVAGVVTDVTAIEAAPVVTTSATGAFTGERVLTGSTGLTIDTSVAGLVSLVLNVITALGYTPAKNSEQYVVAASSGDLSAERVLTGGTGVTINNGTPGQTSVSVSVPTALGYTPANAAGQAFSGNISAPNVECGGFILDITPTATGTASTHSVPINCNGTFYYMRLSSTP